MSADPERPAPFAVAVMWISRITTINLEMIVPALLGRFLDRKLGLSFLTFVGLVLGLVLGVSHLIVMTRPGSTDQNQAGEPQRSRDPSSRDPDAMQK